MATRSGLRHRELTHAERAARKRPADDARAGGQAAAAKKTTDEKAAAESDPSPLLALPEPVLYDLLLRGWDHGPEPEPQEPFQSCAQDFVNLARTCRHFYHTVKDSASGDSGVRMQKLPLMQKLARDLITQREGNRGCARERAGPRVVARAGETWLQMLHQLDWFERMPLDFTAYAPGVTRVGLGEVKLASSSYDVVTAIAGHEHHRMYAGCHYADITVVDPGAADAFMCVGVAQADYDCATNEAVSDSVLGWAWTCEGAVYHNGEIVDQFGDAGKWGRAGDRLTLELDCDIGRLSGWVGGTRLGPLVRGLHTCDLPGENMKREFVFSVEMEEPTSCLRIKWGKPRPVDKYFESTEA
jgi:hypothetical protein